ncbi:DUF2147 domain-containing protein [uncultured Rhodoblastus sp.]|uniref:DUF2147 domain-containing protein n=1 Tax=uncultured Rhodoblastus sp. TaxID=543037 RepID=UPI0025F7FDFD|nr:DUF2147 domain-containing protein [uncultured Rhodoblastus sp.]
MGLFSDFAVKPKLSRTPSIAGLLLAVLAALAFGGGRALAESPPGPSAVGFWQSTSDDGNPSGWFFFTEKNGVAEGRLVKMFKKAGEAHPVDTCVNCPGAMKGAPMLGLTIVTGMKRHGLKYDEGHVLDPRDGSVYNAQMEISPDGQKLFLHGYIGMPVLGQTKTWTRLPDDAIPAAALPPDPMATVGKKSAAPAKAP